MVVEEGEMESESYTWVMQQERQSSIYSLTLEEFQHSVCDTGKNFGSMNMDEFLTSIWSAEDNNNNNSLPPPLCTKTVDEVWSQIQKQQNNNDNLVNNTDSAPRQPTFGEMTLEDFLVKAGVVREPPMVSHSPQHYLNNNNVNVNVNVVAPSYDDDVHVGTAVYGPLSPANSSDGGRKRMVDGPVEKVVERRQRRMIKNRESAARSRARKQAYTVELEAELNQLREENAQLKQGLVELERRRTKQKCSAELKVKVQTKAQKAKEKLRALRRNMSCPL